MGMTSSSDITTNGSAYSVRQLDRMDRKRRLAYWADEHAVPLFFIGLTLFGVFLYAFIQMLPGIVTNAKTGEREQAALQVAMDAGDDDIARTVTR